MPKGYCIYCGLTTDASGAFANPYCSSSPTHDHRINFGVNTGGHDSLKEDPNSGGGGSGGPSSMGYKTYWYNDDGTTQLKYSTDIFATDPSPSTFTSKIIDAKYNPVFLKWDVYTETDNTYFYTYKTAVFYSPKIAHIKEMQEIGGLSTTSTVAPYRCPTLSEIYKYGCKLTLAPSLTYASNQCIRISDLAKCTILFVDLGLPSGTKWGNMNLGATSTSTVGNYYSWGEVLPKETYSLSNYKLRNSNGKFTKYVLNTTEGVMDGLAFLTPEDDAAQVNLSSMWRTPTKEEWQELISNCTWTLAVSNNRLAGYNIKGSNGNSIFLPVSGYKENSTVYNPTYGYYWANSLNSSNTSSNTRYANCILFATSSKTLSDRFRYIGMPIRPVISSTNPAFVIRFVNYDGSSLQIFKIAKGQIPVYSGATPTRPGDTYFTYTFSGWSPTIVAATADATYTALFTATKKT